MRVHVGDQVVRADRKGRFSAQVKTRGAVRVEVDPRDLAYGDERLKYIWPTDDDRYLVALSDYVVEDCH